MQIKYQKSLYLTVMPRSTHYYFRLQHHGDAGLLEKLINSHCYDEIERLFRREKIQHSFPNVGFAQDHESFSGGYGWGRGMVLCSEVSKKYAIRFHITHNNPERLRLLKHWGLWPAQLKKLPHAAFQ